MKNRTIKFLGFCIAIGLSLPVLSADKSDLLAKIRANAGQYNEFKQLLNNPDQNIRIAAFDGMVNSGDSALRNIALDEALANTDSTLQALALKEIIMDLDVLNFSIVLPENASEESKAVVNKWTSSYGLTFFQKNKEEGVFSGKSTDSIQRTGSKKGFGGNLSGLKVFFSSEGLACMGDVVLTAGAILKGTLACPKYALEPVSITAKIR